MPLEIINPYDQKVFHPKGGEGSSLDIFCQLFDAPAVVARLPIVTFKRDRQQTASLVSPPTDDHR